MPREQFKLRPAAASLHRVARQKLHMRTHISLLNSCDFRGHSSGSLRPYDLCGFTPLSEDKTMPRR
jgi:hypothetical protein